ncbi:TonB-dependent receptor [Flavisphingomonas formosensis]|uniref:TonB-dependent receptor n=1 Tax=Flavisphingomonas formosensis TaxID=861534 RepID=UPI001E577946|nr:TonB-dependent receptor [Sphingomonas formosensis]
MTFAIDRIHSTKFIRHHALRYALLLTTIAVLPNPAAAQEGKSASADAAGDDGSIVVTALRRATTVQETPLAITAISSDTLANTGTTNVADLARMTPGLRIQDNGPGQRRLSLRGILSAGEPTVGFYYDETPIAGNVGTGSDAGGRTPDFSLFDVQRVEVLRGPQGTLYGASAMSGAVRIILNKPSEEYEGAADVTAGTVKDGGLSYTLNGMVNAPLAPGLLAVRAVVYRRFSDGYIDNIRLGRNNVNSSAANGGRLMLRFTPASNLTIDGSALIENTDAYSYTWNPDVGRYKIQNYIELPYRDRSQIYNLTAHWDLGPLTATAVTSYQHRRFTYTSGDDSFTVLTQRTPAGCARIVNGGAACSDAQLPAFYAYLDGFIPVAFQTPGWTKDRTHELRFSSNGDHWLNWTAGAFLEDRKNHVDSEDLSADPDSGAVTGDTVYYHRYVNDHYRQVAGFGEVSVKPLAKVTLTAGVRYFHYDRTITGGTDVPWNVLGAVYRPPYKVKTDQNGWLFKFNGEYRVTRDIMVYALAAQGTRPGGANQTIGLPDSLIAYKSDKLWNYELGAKTAFFDRHVTINTAIFQIDWKNMQVSGTTPNGFYSYITNVGASRVRGAELELSGRPAEGLNLFATATYLDAKLTEDQINDFVVAAGRKGDRLPFIPHWTASAGAEYRHPLTRGTDLYARIDANYFGTSYSEFRPTNPYRVRIADYALANARLGVEAPDGVWGVYVYAANLFNSVAINRATRSAFINSYAVTSATPRTIGVNVRRKF